MKEQNFKFKKSFGKLVEKMTDKQAGEFIKAVCGYVFLQKPMESKEEYLKGVFVYVKAALDTEMRDRENGKLGGAITAEKLKGLRFKKRNDTPIAITESEETQVLIVAADETKNGSAPHTKNGKCGKQGNSYGDYRYTNAKKFDRKTM